MFLINVQLKGNLEVMCNYQDQLIGVLFVPYSPWNSHEKKWQADKPLQLQKHSHTLVNTEISTVYRRQRPELEWQHKVPMQREGRERKSQNKDHWEYSGTAGQEVHSGTSTRSVCSRQSVKKRMRSSVGHEHVLGLLKLRGRRRGVWIYFIFQSFSILSNGWKLHVNPT